MPEEVAALNQAQKLKVLRQIQSALCRSEHPTLRGGGLTEAEAQAVTYEPPPDKIVDLFLVADDGSLLDRCRVDKVSESGFGILALGDVAEPAHVPVAVHNPPVPFSQRIRRALANGLWDVVKIALGVPVGILVGYFLWRHHWN